MSRIRWNMLIRPHIVHLLLLSVTSGYHGNRFEVVPIRKYVQNSWPVSHLVRLVQIQLRLTFNCRGGVVTQMTVQCQHCHVMGATKARGEGGRPSLQTAPNRRARFFIHSFKKQKQKKGNASQLGLVRRFCAIIGIECLSQ